MSDSSGSTTVGLLIAFPAFGFFVFIAFVVGIAAALGGAESPECAAQQSTQLSREVPAKLGPIFRAAAAKYRLGPKGPAMLASINFNETTFGTNTENTTGSGAMGWMMFMPATWTAYGVDANADGNRDPFDPEDAIHAAARYLRASGAPRNWHDAIFAYNHAEWYVERILRDFRRFNRPGGGGKLAADPCGVGGEPMLRRAMRLTRPLAFKPLPAGLWIGAGQPQGVDARIWHNVVWLLEAHDLRVTAARESGHKTHGDGTAIDVVPVAGRPWSATAEKAARALGWRSSCGASGTAPACPLAPAIQFVAYNGYPSHGDPGHAGANAHLHVSWKSSRYGCPGLCEPRSWVMAFPAVGGS